MQLNVTFVIQIINFGVFYAVLNAFCFKPLVARISRKEEARQTLLEGLKEKEQLLVRLQAQKKKDLEDFRARITKNYQPVSSQLLEVPGSIVYPSDEQASKELIDQTTQMLVKEVEHAW
jgi:hypothetical protein